MDFWELLKVMARRWYVVVPIIAVTAALAVSMPSRVDPSYRANGTVIIVEPAGSAADLNPFASAGLATNAEALAIVASTPASIAQVTEAGLSTLYTVESEGSVLQVEAEGDSPGQAADTVRFVEQLLSNQLSQQQASVGAPAESFLTVVPLVDDVAPTAIYDDQRRMRILVVAVGVLVAVLATLATEGLVRMSRARRPRGARGARPRRRGSEPAQRPSDGAQAQEQQPLASAETSRRDGQPAAAPESLEAAEERALSGPPVR